MQIAFIVKYIFSIMDTFSRKFIIYPLQNKEAKNIIPYIDFCLHNNIPKEFALAKATEFKNIFFDNYFSLKNIKFIHEVTFNPYS